MYNSGLILIKRKRITKMKVCLCKIFKKRNCVDDAQMVSTESILAPSCDVTLLGCGHILKFIYMFQNVITQLL